MKKFVNNVDSMLRESLDGMAAAHPELLRLEFGPTFLARVHKAQNKVALLSGGGSGHEPLHAGFVGRGMLDAACPGHVFTSPTPDQMLAAALSVEAGRGVLFIVKNYAGRVNAGIASMGVTFTSCTVPAAGRATFDIGDDEMEFGVGIHGEPGRRREKVRPASQIVEDLLAQILADLAPGPGRELLLHVNGFGGTPLTELYLLYGNVARQLRARGLQPVRSLVGNHTTSMEMAGASLTVALLDDETKALWDAPVHTAALHW